MNLIFSILTDLCRADGRERIADQSVGRGLEYIATSKP